MRDNPPDEYLTIKDLAQSKLKIKGSIFIASAISVSSEKEAKDWIKKISKQTFDATHHCFAYKIKTDQNEIVKYSDAGEPKGTAGNPILSAIESEKLSNVLVVVVRYFGGTKLGTGGLSRAYRLCAQAVLKDCEKIRKFITATLSFYFHISYISKMHQVLSRFDCKILEESFEKDVTIKAEVRKGNLEKLKKVLSESTNGQIKFI
ncbi:MAG: YigZ family protein [candidate division Zixibacteria bacterium]|nr:YigZ family protein [candidate division Zixibacteria bacterium]MCK4428445.1 YigZ family protein [candidate division Zixibacteria bacterium]